MSAAPASHRCDWCGYLYDPAAGDPGRGISPGTPFDRLPADWRCPDCRAPKADFTPLAGPVANPIANPIAN